ncbi:MAG: phage major capsid protein [Betaproteobacteria bacterium]|nr:phage major capsid protein [Betaproteobacteria bacterium]
MTALEALNQKRAEVVGDIEALKASVSAASRSEFNAEEAEKLSGLINQADHLSNQIDLHKKTEQLAVSMSITQPRQVEPVMTSTVAARPTFSGGTTVSAGFANHGFVKGFSEFLGAVRNAAFGRVDPRLTNAVTTYGAEGVGPDGGFAVPPEYAAQITSTVTGEDSLVAKFNPIMTSGNQVVLPTDETTPYGTTGIYAEWLAEAGSYSDRKPVLKQTTVTLNKVGAMVQLSDELAADAPAIQSFVMRKVADAITSKVNEAIVTGSGVAKPLGLSNAPGKVTQAKSGTTLAAVDIANMLSRVANIQDSFFLCHSSFLPKIWTLTLGQMPIFVSDFRQSPYGTILGRPVFVTEYCSDYNTLGDIYLVSPSGYLLAVKSGGIQTSASIHFAFNQDIQSFKAVMRVGGTPIASAAQARKNGSTTLGHIITLEVRS